MLRPRTARLLLALPVAAAPLLLLAPPAHAATTHEWLRDPVTFTTRTLDFKVTVGPSTAPQTCNVEADLRIPAGVTASSPAPAILTSNGFGGSKDSTGATASNASYAMQYARQGYVTLSYSGLGFGHSTCNIELDSPAYDGLAGKALVSFLGGDVTNAFTSFTAGTGGLTPAWSGPLSAADAPPVQLDACNHAPTPRCGTADPHDPRVGMIGGSYGGENQLATADVDPRVDTIIPQITWNDLVYSLAPNNLGALGDDRDGPGTAPVTQTIAGPGVEKQEWVTLFFGVGASQPVSGNGGAVGSSTCPDFDPAACTAKAQLDAMGYPDAATEDFAHSASAGTYLSHIHIPVFLSQGQDDTLFNLREATTTFLALEHQDNDVKMLWQQWGHSGGPVAGEANGDSTVPVLFDDLRYSAWFAKYLRDDSNADTGPSFEYYTPWLTNHGSATVPTDTYTGSDTFPVGHAQPLYLSGGTATGTGSLVHDASQVMPGTADFAVSPATTTSYTETSAVDQSQPVTDAPGTFAAFSSPPLAANADQVGSPTLTVTIAAPSGFAATQSQPVGQLVVFAKLYDVSPSGTITLVNRVSSPTRVTDVTKPVVIHLPSIVHRYPAGDHLEVVLSSGDTAYKGNDATGPVQIVTDATHVNTLSVPYTNADGAVFSAAPTAALPEVGAPVLLLAVGGLGAAGVALLRRRRRVA